jgi:recombinational DNA repair protein RecT
MLDIEKEKAHIRKWVPDIPDKMLNDFLDIVMASGLTASQESPKLFWTVTKYTLKSGVDYVIDPTYHAMIEIAYKSGLASVNNHIVKECDIIRASSPSHAGGGTLYWEANLLNKQRHASPMAGVYTVATLNGAIIDEFLGMDYLDRVYAIRKNKTDFSPWAKWTDEMYLKTGIRHIFKKLPSNSQMLAVMRQFDKGFEISETPSPAKAAAEAVKAALQIENENRKTYFMELCEDATSPEVLLKLREKIAKEAPDEVQKECQDYRLQVFERNFPKEYSELKAKYAKGGKS